MRIPCEKCGKPYDDEFYWTICPHNPITMGHRPEDYCRRHDLAGPCPVCDPSVPKSEQHPLTQAVIDSNRLQEVVEKTTLGVETDLVYDPSAPGGCRKPKTDLPLPLAPSGWEYPQLSAEDKERGKQLRNYMADQTERIAKELAARAAELFPGVQCVYELAPIDLEERPIKPEMRFIIRPATPEEILKRHSNTP
jgi:hypothetical protein